MSDSNTYTIIVKRPDDIFKIDISAPKELNDAQQHQYAVRRSRAFNDAVDLFLYIRKRYKDTKEFNIDFNMVNFRKMCRHNGDEEETLMIEMLQSLLAGYGFIPVCVGFPLNEQGEVADDTILNLHFKKSIASV